MMAAQIHNDENSLRVLLGSGRSGTTWVQDVLCQANGLHPTFEPLHPAAWKNARPFSRKYASAADEWPELTAFFQQVQGGQYSKVWSDYRVRPDRLRPKLTHFASLNALKRYSAHWRRLLKARNQYRRPSPQAPSLIKLIRANLMAPFLMVNLKAKMAFIMRHPATVVESQLRLGVDWNAQEIASHYSKDDRLEKRIGCSWDTLVKKTRSDAELFTLIWCLENLLPLEDMLALDASHGADGFVFYEHLAQHKKSAWQQLLDALRLSKWPEVSELNKPSQQASMTGQRKTIDQKQLEKSLHRLTSEQKKDIQCILDYFNVTLYHTNSALPLLDTVNQASAPQWDAAKLINRSL